MTNTCIAFEEAHAAMNSVRQKTASLRLPICVAVFVAVICIGILGLSSWRAWVSRSSDLKTAEIEMSNLARSLTQHAEDTFDLLDASIIGVATRLELEGTGPAAMASLQKVLKARQSALKRIHGLFIYDENGLCLATSGLAGPDISDREYFRYHMQSASRDALIGNPVQRRPGGGWITTVSRRFNHSDGSFGGLVLATVGSEYFSEFYKEFDIGEKGAIILLNNAGIILARSKDNNIYAGRDMSDTPLMRNRSSPPSNGVYYFKSPLDGVTRLSFYRKSDRFPINVLATRAEDEVLATWRQNAITRMIFVVALTLLIAVIGFFLVRQLVRGQRLVSALAAQEADFRLLAENSSDMVTRIGMDERIQYVSPSSIRVVGWSPEQLIGTPALAGVNAEDLPAVQATVAALKRGEERDARIVYRSRHRKKTEVWIESTMRVTRELGTDKINGVVAISRDMTEHKDLEQKLASLATLDGLTGIANRRHFDEHLEREWARARRDGTALSLLLIDVDHFKKYNDRYGHQAGDACLKSVAQVLAAQARRPADFAARYGGEEFVLLLPDTDRAGCELIATRIRDCLADLGIDHELSLPSQKVTVSIGGAIAAFQDSKASSSSLVEAADRALYVAKDEGRDRLVMSGRVLTLSNGRIAVV
ncbi:MAG: hypothetical protein JWR89_92 [Tardiphaga sp.]|nr:hypothetical protein [Tardiphaga sp.]